MFTERLEFAPTRDSELFAAIPPTPAVFLLRATVPHAEPYVSKTTNLRRRLQRLLGPPTELTRRLNLRERVSAIEYTPTGSDFESGFLLYRVLRSVFPETYSKRLRFRFAPLLKLHLENEFPRALITTRLGRMNGGSLYYGPFPSRTMAEKFANDCLDYFKLRRCVEDLNPDPAFPGCIYSEMKMCLAPCFKGCTDEEYSTETSRVQSFFDSRGESLVREIADQRDTASLNLDFEGAATLHAKIEKLKPLLSLLPEAVHRIDRLSGLIVQPSSEAESVTFFRLDAGMINRPVCFHIQADEHTKSQSMESRIEQTLAAIPPSKASVLEIMEHLAILKRWYYRSSRIGEAFFADNKGELPLRRIVRGVARIYRGEKVQAEIAPDTVRAE